MADKTYSGFVAYAKTTLRAATYAEAAEIYGQAVANFMRGSSRTARVLVVAASRSEVVLPQIAAEKETTVQKLIDEGCYVAFRNPLEGDIREILGWCGSFNNIAEFASIASATPFPDDGFECKLFINPVYAYLWANGSDPLLRADMIEKIATDLPHFYNADSLKAEFANITLVFRPHVQTHDMQTHDVQTHDVQKRKEDREPKSFALTLDKVFDVRAFVHRLGKGTWRVRNFLDAEAAALWLGGSDDVPFFAKEGVNGHKAWAALNKKKE